MSGRAGLDGLRLAAIAAVLVLLGFTVAASQGCLALSLPDLPGAGDREKPASYVPPKLPDGRQRAFPTAEGFGAGAKGGRGGAVLFVTTTAEEGEGSLRACIEAEGPRTCVFRVSGTITLKKRSLVITNPYLTIAGETAPGGGIAIRNSPRQLRPSVEILTHDVIIRHLRLRPGPHEQAACCSGALGFYGEDATDIIVDHVSASWGSDETIDSEGARNITIQWGIISEPLLDGGPGKRNRARNMLLTMGGNFSIHHNLFAFGKFRNPQIQMEGRGVTADVVNNVLYSPVWDYVISFSDRAAKIRANVVGNYKIAGAKEKDDHLVHLFDEGGKGYAIHLAGNIDETYRPDDGMAEDLVVAEEQRGAVVSAPFDVAHVRALPAREAYDEVLAKAGATRPLRDAVDRRIVEAVHTRSGHLLKSDPEDVGGWPHLASAPPPADEDRDGMADSWELSVGLSPTSAADGLSDLDGDGWTNFEEYLHELAGDGRGMDAARLAAQQPQR
ncbi:pectate lyase family protein [Rhodoligotrophos defluvii]|uniref:pectate lyase family protein n=1 Tax=Rhodoligotrophos defluvii TaxID=2561934 RepID=UPI0010CA0058|nr:pectate lyase [Rhodoligotrophos defluvii]